MSIKAELRTKTGTGASKQARREGKIPATLYGKEVEATSLLVLSLIHISEPTRREWLSRMPSSA